VGFSGIVSIGDQLDVDIADLLDYFALDPKTQAILLYIEAIKRRNSLKSCRKPKLKAHPEVEAMTTSRESEPGTIGQ
jgi:acetyltransferase